MTDEQNHTDEERITEAPEEARQGRRGIPVLVSLFAALVIAVIFWFGLTYYGKYLDPDQPAALGQATEEMAPGSSESPSDASAPSPEAAEPPEQESRSPDAQ